MALDAPDPAAVDALLLSGAAGISIPAGALATRRGLLRVAPLLERVAAHGAPLLVHPGPAPWRPMPWTEPDAPGWWPALTAYVAEMHAAWHAFLAWGRADHPGLTIVWAMLAGGAPLHAERLAARGGPADVADPRSFYDISSYGALGVESAARAVGVEQLVYGSDRPMAEPPAVEGAPRAAILHGGPLAGPAAAA